MGKGFTLIELLVVVLIIGILAAVALPQYEKSVEKSRAAEAVQMLRYMNQQKQLYILANGVDAVYKKKNEDLGIELPAGLTCSWTGEEEICCNKDWCYINTGFMWGSICVGNENVIAARMEGDGREAAADNPRNLKYKYTLEYETCEGSANTIVCYGKENWCKLFKGEGNPI